MVLRLSMVRRRLVSAVWFLAAVLPASLVAQEAVSPVFTWGTPELASDSGQLLGRPTRTISAAGVRLTASACRSSRFTQVWLSLRWSGLDSLAYTPESARLEVPGRKPRVLKYRSPREIFRRLLGGNRFTFEVRGVDEAEARENARQHLERELQPRVDSVNRALENQLTPAVLSPGSPSVRGDLFFELGPEDSDLQLTVPLAIGRFVVPVPEPLACP